MPKNAVAVRTGPSPALVKTRNALEALQQKYLDYRKTKGEELKQARSVGMTDVVVLSGSSAVGAAVAGTARGVGKRFDDGTVFRAAHAFEQQGDWEKT